MVNYVVGNYIIGALFVFLIATILGFVMGIFKKIKNAKICKGTVVEKEYAKSNYQSGRSNSQKAYYGHVLYFVDGMEYRIRTRYASSYYLIDKKVLVKYNVEKPEEAIVLPSIILYLCVIALYFLGLWLIIREFI